MDEKKPTRVKGLNSKDEFEKAIEGTKGTTSKDEFGNTIEGLPRLAAIDCYAEWCGPCNAISNQFRILSLAHTDADFYKLDVDALSGVASDLGVRAMPTFVFFKGGEKVHEVVGANRYALEAAILTRK